MKLERRVFSITEIRVDGEEGKMPTLRGHAAVFDKWSVDLGGFKEIIRPGTFARTIKIDDVRALWNHEPIFPLGRTKNDTLSLNEDKRGLAFELDPPDTVMARGFVESIRRGDVDQMSFAFRTISDRWGKEDGELARELLEVKLFEVSPVTFPAYPQTDVSARALFAERGVHDFDEIAATLSKTRSGEELTPGENEIIQKSIAILNGAADDKPVQVSMLRRRLDIATREI